MKILAIQNRMGIGDMVIFLPYIEAISKKFDSPVSILVKENSKAIQFLGDNKNIDEIIILDRGNKKKNSRHDGFGGSLNLANDLRKRNFDKVFIFNSSFRFNLISRIAGIKKIYQYPLFRKKNQHIINTAEEFLKKEIQVNVKSNPQILVNKDAINEAKSKYKIQNSQLNILLGIGGSGETKRIPSKIFIEFMELVSKSNDCRFFLATGKNEEEQKILSEILITKFKDKCTTLDSLSLKEILPIIKNCKIAICNDSSFSHLSSALGVETIVLMSDTPLLYGSYSPKMHPIIPDGEEHVTHDTMGKNRINSNKIFSKLKNIID
jgi:heptosyltransferase II